KQDCSNGCAFLISIVRHSCRSHISRRLACGCLALENSKAERAANQTKKFKIHALGQSTIYSDLNVTCSFRSHEAQPIQLRQISVHSSTSSPGIGVAGMARDCGASRWRGSTRRSDDFRGDLSRS